MYQTRVEAEDVILGNHVILQCQIPSHVADLVQVLDWVDSQGSSFARNRYGNLMQRDYGFVMIDLDRTWLNDSLLSLLKQSFKLLKIT